jgi:hypothetical protein
MDNSLQNATEGPELVPPKLLGSNTSVQRDNICRTELVSLLYCTGIKKYKLYAGITQAI